MHKSRKSKGRALAVAIMATASIGSVAADSAFAQPAASRIKPLVDGMYPALETIYKDIHANPELSFKETRTAAKLAEEIRSIGFDVTERIGGTGIVGVYKNGPGPTVLVRTELDALPMEEKTGGKLEQISNND